MAAVLPGNDRRELISCAYMLSIDEVLGMRRREFMTLVLRH